MRKFFLISIFFYLLLFNSVSSQQFGSRIDKGVVKSNDINEASGIVPSIKNPGLFWVHNDSGDKARIFAIDSLGNSIATVYLSGIKNRDWEDICIGPGEVEGEQYIYIGEIGDNSKRYFPKYIYRIIEPKLDMNKIPIDTVITEVDRLPFGYENGKRNAETLMIDPSNLDLYIVSKEQNTKVYKLSFPYTFYSAPTSNIDTAFIVGTLPFSTAVGGDISLDGNEILIKKYNVIYYWKKDESGTIIDALQKTPITVPYFIEPQGEAVCWAPDLSGYYTISEGLHPHLYFYPRITTGIFQNDSYPNDFKLEQNYPNPFNPSTIIKYTIPRVTHPSILTREDKERSDRGVLITLKVYDILGHEVTTLVNKEKKPGNYEVTFNANNLSSGLYFYRITATPSSGQAGSFTKTKKMILLR